MNEYVERLFERNMIIPVSQISLHSMHGLAESGVLPVIGWSLVLIALLLVGFFAVTWLRQWMKADDAPATVGFTLSDLRELHRQGKMSDAEFEKARSLIVGATKAAAGKLPDPLARPGRALRQPRRQQPPPPE